jgi:lipid-binding SYLF domain-containing protein
MKRQVVLLATLLLLSTLCWGATEKEKVVTRLQDAAEVLQSMVKAPDKGIPEEVLARARCIAVIPHEVKGGFVIGGAHGRGVATCRTKTGWSAPAFITISGGSWGAQIGLEGIDNVLLFMNQRGLDKLLSSKVQIGADVSAAAGPIGRHASAGTDWKMETEMLSYSRAKGVFAGATLNGAYVSQDTDAMKAMYGPNVTFQDVLTGKVPPPPEAREFLAVVQKVTKEAKTEKSSES